MRRRRIGIWIRISIAGWLAAFGCTKTPAPTPVPAPSSAAPSSVAPASPAAAKPYGEALPAGPGDDLGRVLADPSAYADLDITVEGVVRQVCQRRGCWLELATSSDEAAPGCRVTSRGHAFFVPTDSAGSRARVRGRAEVEIIPAAQVAHMEAEGGSFARKQPDGSARELRIVASGVELAPRSR
jgi:hypothetical protein